VEGDRADDAATELVVGGGARDGLGGHSFGWVIPGAKARSYLTSRSGSSVDLS
jgi:hypothetical protein